VQVAGNLSENYIYSRKNHGEAVVFLWFNGFGYDEKNADKPAVIVIYSWDACSFLS
jgi:hypothetical protein